MKRYKRVLTIAGSDSGGGAGVQADIKTISACGCYATSAITAVTVQNTVGVRSFVSIPADVVAAQIESVVEDIGTDSVKIGMVPTPECIKAIADTLSRLSVKSVVVDPVMVATSGHNLSNSQSVNALQEFLLPLARVITPNVPEAEILSGVKIETQNQLMDLAELLARKYNVSVLVKAGHLQGDELSDVLYNIETGSVIRLSGKRVDTENTHGTGCTLSSAIASMLAKGYALDDAVKQAKSYLYEALVAGSEYKIGEGHGPVCHFYNLWK